MKFAWLSHGSDALFWSIPVCLVLVSVGILMIIFRSKLAELLRSHAKGSLFLKGYADIINETYVIIFAALIFLAAGSMLIPLIF